MFSVFSNHATRFYFLCHHVVHASCMWWQWQLTGSTCQLSYSTTTRTWKFRSEALNGNIALYVSVLLFLLADLFFLFFLRFIVNWWSRRDWTKDVHCEDYKDAPTASTTYLLSAPLLVKFFFLVGSFYCFFFISNLPLYSTTMTTMTTMTHQLCPPLLSRGVYFYSFFLFIACPFITNLIYSTAKTDDVATTSTTYLLSVHLYPLPRVFFGWFFFIGSFSYYC